MKRQELLMSEYKKFKVRSGNGRSTKTVRIKKIPIVTLTKRLVNFYPMLENMRAGEKVNFLIFLLERSLRSRDADYVCSWDSEYAMNKKDHYKTNDILGS